jgi:hypothetical protein
MHTVRWRGGTGVPVGVGGMGVIDGSGVGDADEGVQPVSRAVRLAIRSKPANHHAHRGLERRPSSGRSGRAISWRVQYQQKSAAAGIVLPQYGQAIESAGVSFMP